MDIDWPEKQPGQIASQHDNQSHPEKPADPLVRGQVAEDHHEDGVSGVVPQERCTKRESTMFGRLPMREEEPRTHRRAGRGRRSQSMFCGSIAL